MEKSINLYSRFSLNLEDVNTLNLLYMPLIGNDAITLYLLLNSLLNKQTLSAINLKLDDLLTILGWKAKRYLDARSKLEGIGLVERFENSNDIIMFLRAVLTESNFIKDSTLGMFLKNKIGDDLFKKICNLVTIFDVNLAGYINQTKQFDEIFTTFIDTNEYINGNYKGRKDNRGINISSNYFDFELFLNKINPDFIVGGVTDNLKNKLNSLAFTYGLKVEQMVNIYNDSIDNQGRFNLEKFSKLANQTFSNINQNKEVNLDTNDSNNLLCDRFDKMSAGELLKELGFDERELLTYLKKVSKIYENFKLPYGALNFMIVYVYKQKQMLPSYNYFEKVYEDWLDKGISTTYEAYNYVVNKEYPNKKLNTTKKVTKKSDFDLVDWQKDDVLKGWGE